MLPARIEALLNSGQAVAVELPNERLDATCFVRIRPEPKLGVPREERRYLNSTWSMWEYWDFEFRRFVLRDGWKSDEWNYDLYIIEDQRVKTIDPESFQRALMNWVPNTASFQHAAESECPE